MRVTWWCVHEGDMVVCVHEGDMVVCVREGDMVVCVHEGDVVCVHENLHTVWHTYIHL